MVGRREHGQVRVGHLCDQKGPRRRIDLHALQGLLRRFPLRQLSEILSVHGYLWWAAASTAKLGLGVSAIRRGHAGEFTFMPFKAFSVASLFVGVAASTAVDQVGGDRAHVNYILIFLKFSQCPFCIYRCFLFVL
ncbi:hypothetical protein PHJA_002150700 [Phtheirospermum japonicum]|uniref:Uncharacterized protein n=1 Tax=Phtheirospermum japonicum TaxID=374723 RepID=A0A830CL82_9LAMI|nr:hypothetical protein PHJA_002150700 [Phtheirospermum japonicum]